ncbi:hypothetical protein CP061683_0355 [Chlamydia psittaci 06-1683]|nr:hypothetical protein CP061683_0355 [Chlamydia psittaci 06-1683]
MFPAICSTKNLYGAILTSTCFSSDLESPKIGEQEKKNKRKRNILYMI